jgi:hypothetical protein
LPAASPSPALTRIAHHLAAATTRLPASVAARFDRQLRAINDLFVPRRVLDALVN